MALRLYSKMMHEIRYWLLRKLPPCKVIAPLMSESLDRPLTLRERILLRLHLGVCIWCVWYLEQLQQMRNALRHQASTTSEDESTAALSLSREARERMKHALQYRER